MSADQALELMKLLFWNSAVVSAPVLIAALLVGLVVSVLQVATQLQEATLSYVPKLIVSVLVLMALGGWMMSRITSFATHLIQMIPSLV
ncbi:flagellar biosynthesis protein FliQ [Caulobacter sp. CCNWLY153]|jgi:flagellar biosynthetic protein FliQ|uniref:Flagellar biosynthetic protein FliQ n=1 Tax=Caulobacter radicis TaxID=2172650 RepID=A0A2T9JGN2_9CAUL|nr:flagellar biosynthesis protein FliQ [Caulobacter radicis]PVM82860.1 flagellar biosynthetic protein FliQ [Caulobacter radicis]PVM84403.1 flagellar biosynthetic protein FliQ [Caulobacter radicis]